MSDSWLDKTEDERKELIYNTVKNEIGITNFNKHGILLGFLKIISGFINIVYFYLLDFSDQIDVTKARKPFLDLLGFIVGVIRKPAKKTKRYFNLKPSDDGKIKAGTWIKVKGTELRYKTIDEINYNKDIEIQFLVEAENEGSNYNISNSFDIEFPKVIDSIDEIYIPIGDNFILQAGLDEESDESLRKRIIAKCQSLGEENPPSKYEYLALSVDGVLDAKVIRTPRGAGSIDIVLSIVDTLDFNTISILVLNSINDRIGVCKDIRIRKANEKLFNTLLTFIGDDTSVKVRLLVEKYFSDVKIGESRFIARLYNYLVLNLNVSSLLIDPNTDFKVDIYELIKINLNVIKG